MLYLVHMQVSIPADTDPAALERLMADEKAYSQKLQSEGQVASSVARGGRVRELQRVRRRVSRCASYDSVVVAPCIGS